MEKGVCFETEVRWSVKDKNIVFINWGWKVNNTHHLPPKTLATRLLPTPPPSPTSMDYPFPTLGSPVVKSLWVCLFVCLFRSRRLIVMSLILLSKIGSIFEDPGNFWMMHEYCRVRFRLCVHKKQTILETRKDTNRVKASKPFSVILSVFRLYALFWFYLFVCLFLLPRQILPESLHQYALWKKRDQRQKNVMHLPEGPLMRSSQVLS